MSDAHRHIEVERKWLLHRLPDRLLGTPDPECTRLEIRQGYLPPVSPDEPAWSEASRASEHEVPTVGRIRAIESDRGNRYVHTLKSGSGLVRHEFEREISEEAFQAAWSATAGRRLAKTRWRVPEGEVCWEIDRISGLDVVLAEVECASIELASSVTLPEWLAAVVDREVTEEDRFTNAEMAFQSGLATGDPGFEGGVDEIR